MEARTIVFRRCGGRQGNETKQERKKKIGNGNIPFDRKCDYSYFWRVG